MNNPKQIIIIGGGTINHVRNHLAICAPAYGSTAKILKNKFEAELLKEKMEGDYEVKLVLTKMADSASRLETNDDVSMYVDSLITNPDVKVIVFNAALADFKGEIGGEESGKYSKRLRTMNGEINMRLIPSDKIIAKIKEKRKDILVVGFKTTSDEEVSVQYERGLNLLRQGNLSAVIANDTVTRMGLMITPGDERYKETKDRDELLGALTRFMVNSMKNSFLKSHHHNAATTINHSSSLKP